MCFSIRETLSSDLSIIIFFFKTTLGEERGENLSFFTLWGLGVVCSHLVLYVCLPLVLQHLDANGRKSAAICLALICHLCNVLCDFFKQNSKQQILRYNRINGM